MTGVEHGTRVATPESPLLHAVDDAEIADRAAEHGLVARLAFASALRANLEAFAISTAGDDVVAKASSLLREAHALLAHSPQAASHVRTSEGALTGLGRLSELGPFTGRLHAITPLFRLYLGGDRTEAFATYSARHEGAPGLVQGGFIAATFDELLGVSQAGIMRVTANLQISYRAPAPLFRELRYSSWLERIDGRKALVKGALHDGDRLCAEASALFIEPRQSTG